MSMESPSSSLIHKPDFDIDNANLKFQAINYHDHLNFNFRIETTRNYSETGCYIKRKD